MRKCATLYSEGTVMLIDPPCLVDKVKQVAQENQDLPDFENVYHKNFTIEDTLETMVEKLSILTHIYSREFQKYVERGHSKDLLE